MSAKSLVAWAELLRKSGQVDEALAAYQEVIAQRPSNVAAKARLTEFLQEMGRLDDKGNGGGGTLKTKGARRRPLSKTTAAKELKFRFSKTAEHVLTHARTLADASERSGVTSSCILFAIAELAGTQDDTTRFVRGALDQAGRYKAVIAQFLRDTGSVKGQNVSDGGPPLGKVSRNVRALLENALAFARRTSGESNEIHTRHLFAAMIVAPDRGYQSLALHRFNDLAIELPTLRRDFREFIYTHYSSDDPVEWDVILTPGSPRDPEPKSLEHDFFAGPAGYTSEFCGVGGSEPVSDHLGVEGLAHRLAELIALRETKLPLAVGLFGNWGSGKSHFMNLMDRHMKKLAAETTEDWARRAAQSGIGWHPGPDSKGPWCREIVPIYFNAWHYLDTNLWASLVTEIFDRLFRHVAGDSDSAEHRKEKIKKLMAELQKANGAAASAEETLELAKAAKARAEAEEQKAEVAAQRAARQRDRLEGWMDGVLDNLEKLLPEGEMQEGWREAVRVLHLEEARKSYAALAAHVTEFQSLQGRVRAIGRAVLAPEGRTADWLGSEEQYWARRW